MALIDIEKKQIHVKLAFCGSGMVGKTTNLQYIHSQVPREDKGELSSLATQYERFLFFDFIHPTIREIKGFELHFHLYAVPG